MTLQIKSICLYNSNGDKRILPFEMGKVNIITGKSRTGKTAIISIVDYCLGRSTFTVPDGVIERTVSWYSLLLEYKKKQIFIAKPKPDLNNESQSKAYLKIGANIEIPNLEDININSNDDLINEELSNLIEINPNLHEPDINHTRLPLASNFKHTKHYLFQRQNLIATDNLLFYRQEEPFMSQTIKDTLQYFLGAVEENELLLKEKLNQKKRARQKLVNEINRLQNIEGSNEKYISALIEEAKTVNLLSADYSGESLTATIEILKDLLENWQPYRIEHFNSENPLENLIQKREKIIEEIKYYNQKIAYIKSYSQVSTSYSDVVEEQWSRLNSIRLFEDINDKQCPICSSELPNPIPQVVEINNSIRRLDANLIGVKHSTSDLNKHVLEYQKSIGGCKEELEKINFEIGSLSKLDAKISKIQSLNNKQAIVIGRISICFQELLNLEDNQLDISLKKLELIEQEIESLIQEISEDNKIDILNSILNIIAVQMTEWATKLNLEYSGSPYRFDYKNLTVIADTSEKPIPMKKMGSAENWLGCHLICLLALHKVFIDKKRPVPGFIILDQPTQAYFPHDIYEKLGEEDEPQLNDEDLVSVENMYNFLFEVCSKLAPNLQIIVLDHASLLTNQFKQALVEEPWRNGRALIPNEWYE